MTVANEDEKSIQVGRQCRIRPYAACVRLDIPGVPCGRVDSVPGFHGSRLQNGALRTFAQLAVRFAGSSIFRPAAARRRAVLFRAADRLFDAPPRRYLHGTEHCWGTSPDWKVQRLNAMVP